MLKLIQMLYKSRMLFICLLSILILSIVSTSYYFNKQNSKEIGISSLNNIGYDADEQVDEIDNNQLANTKWQYKGGEISFTNRKFNATVGCENISGEYITNSKDLKLLVNSITQMDCTDYIDQIDQSFVEDLDKITSVKFINDAAVMSGDNLRVVFVPLEFGNVDSSEILYISDKTADCKYLNNQKCLIVNDSVFLNSIEGFNFEPNYEYIIEARKKKIADSMSDSNDFNYEYLNTIDKYFVENANDSESIKNTEWFIDETEFGKIKFTNNSFGLNLGCNTISGTFDEDTENNKIKFQGFLSTKIQCTEDLAIEESSLVSKLGRVSSYKQTSNELSLLGVDIEIKLTRIESDL